MLRVGDEACGRVGVAVGVGVGALAATVVPALGLGVPPGEAAMGAAFTTGTPSGAFRTPQVIHYHGNLICL